MAQELRVFGSNKKIATLKFLAHAVPVSSFLCCRETVQSESVHLSFLLAKRIVERDHEMKEGENTFSQQEEQNGASWRSKDVVVGIGMACNVLSVVSCIFAFHYRQN